MVIDSSSVVCSMSYHDRLTTLFKLHMTGTTEYNSYKLNVHCCYFDACFYVAFNDSLNNNNRPSSLDRSFTRSSAVIYSYVLSYYFFFHCRHLELLMLPQLLLNTLAHHFIKIY